MKIPFGPPNLVWYVIRVKPQMERTAYIDIIRTGFLAHLPERRIVGFNRRQTVRTERTEPLWPGYLFAAQPAPPKCKGEDWPLLNGCKGVIGPLETSDNWGELHPLSIPAKVVQDLWLAELNGEFDDTPATKEERAKNLATRFPAGTRVRIMDGPFASFWGEVEKLTKQEHIEVLVNIFGRYTKAEFEPQQVEAA